MHHEHDVQVEEHIQVAASGGTDWTLTAMALVGGVTFLVIGALTMSFFPLGGIIEATLGGVTLLGIMLSMTKSAH